MKPDDYRAAVEALSRDAAAFHAGSFDDSGLPIEDQCSATHPDTGHGCIEPIGHDGLHRAMGLQRMQRFGPEAAIEPIRAALAEREQEAG